MAFLLLFLCGFCGGVLGGMGMGGGTALIPLLTVVLGVEQGTAQGINLLAFLPMSAAALAVHKKNGLLEKEGLADVIVPALLSSLLFSAIAVRLPASLLGKGFGVLLIVLSVRWISEGLSRRQRAPQDGKKIR